MGNLHFLIGLVHNDIITVLSFIHLTYYVRRDNIIVEKVLPIDGQSLVIKEMTKMPLQFTRQGGYFCVLFLSLPKEYPIPKQVKPKLTTAIKSPKLIWLSPPFHQFQKSGFYVIGGSQSLRSEGLTAYRNMVAPTNNYNNKLLLYQCIAIIYNTFSTPTEFYFNRNISFSVLCFCYILYFVIL